MKKRDLDLESFLISTDYFERTYKTSVPRNPGSGRTFFGSAKELRNGFRRCILMFCGVPVTGNPTGHPAGQEALPSANEYMINTYCSFLQVTVIMKGCHA